MVAKSYTELPEVDDEMIREKVSLYSQGSFNEFDVTSRDTGIFRIFSRARGMDGTRRYGAVCVCFRRVRRYGSRPAELAEVGLDGVQGECRRDDGGDGDDGAARRAVSVPLERMTGGDVALDGEPEHEQRTQVLRRQEEDRKQLAQSGILQQRHSPASLQLVQHLLTTTTVTYAGVIVMNVELLVN